MSILKNIFCAALAVAGIASIAFIVSKIVGQDPEKMTIDQLIELRDRFIKEDTSIGYMKAAYVRDMIAKRTSKWATAA